MSKAKNAVRVTPSGRDVHEWEKGLPKFEELVPLNQKLITPILASAFSIREAEVTRTVEEVERAAKVRRKRNSSCNRMQHRIVGSTVCSCSRTGCVWWMLF